MTCENDQESAEQSTHTASQDLRTENERLKQMLKRAEELAVRQTIMLREADHRIKNSLQIVASLMGLQASREETPSARDALRAAAARIQSVGQMHDALQSGGGENSLDLGALIERMCASLQEMGGRLGAVAVRVKAAPMQIHAELARPIVLAVNELVVNALRHAFPGGRSGAIDVSLERADGQLQIVVSDNGVGLPLNHGESRGYGMRLVRMMATQIGAALSVDGSAGTRVTIIVTGPTVALGSNDAALSNGRRAPKPKSTGAARLLTVPFPRKSWDAAGRG